MQTNLRSFLLSPLALCAAMLAGCASTTPPADQSASGKPAIIAANSGIHTTREHRFLGIFSPFHPDIQQGNFVSREMITQVKETMKTKNGMTPEQVRFVMGTPLLMDVFHKDRWDYPFRMEKSNGEVITSHVVLYFKNNRLVNVEGGDLPTEREYIQLIAGEAPPVDAKAPAINK